MILLYWISAVLAAYFFLVFVVLRLVVPFMGFKQYLPPTDLPPEIKSAIIDLENKSHDPMSYLQAVYDLVLDKTIHQWKHTRFKAGTRLYRLFVKDLAEIWQTHDFVYCQAINFVVYVLLANSKYFKTSDVKVKHVFANFVCHQYLQVKIGGNWVDVDPAGSGIRGKPLGTHLSWFG
jgi:hypothetical protein